MAQEQFSKLSSAAKSMGGMLGGFLGSDKKQMPDQRVTPQMTKAQLNFSDDEGEDSGWANVKNTPQQQMP